MTMPNRNVVGDYRYDYQGQEKDKETGLNAFQLRMYDARIGRWLIPDPKGEFFSPYLAMGNNPIVYIDPDGGMTSGGCPDPPCDGAGNVLLDTVFITGHKPGSSGWSDLLNKVSDLAVKTGQHFVVMGGASINAFGSDLVLGAGRMNGNSFDNSEFGTSFRLGQIVGDAAAMVAGGLEITAGSTLAAGGVVATPVTLGASLAGTVAGAAVVTHGGTVVLTGGWNLAGGIIGLTNYSMSRNHDSGGDRMGGNGRGKKQFNDVIKQLGIKDSKGFSKFLHKRKSALGMGGADNFTWSELVALGKEFLANGGR